MSVAAISPCQKKTSPRISSVKTPVEIVFECEVVMNASAYTKSFRTSEKEKMTAVRIPGTEIGKTTRSSVWSRDAPSTSAASSSSAGIVLKKPIRSHVANGTVNEGKTSISDSSRSWRPMCAITHDIGREKSVGGAGEGRKKAVPRARRQGQGERDHDDHDPDEDRVLHPREVLGVVEEEAVAPRRRRPLAEPEGHVVHVVEVDVALEARPEHPVEGEREHDRERAEDGVRGQLLAQRDHETSTLLAKRSISTATTTRSGSR